MKKVLKGKMFGYNMQLPTEAIFDILSAVQSRINELIEELAERNEDGTKNTEWIETEIKRYRYILQNLREMH